MSKILLALGLAAALATPAAAGRLDVDPSQLSAPAAPSVDFAVTRSIASDDASSNAADRLAENRKLFGADSR